MELHAWSSRSRALACAAALLAALGGCRAKTGGSIYTDPPDPTVYPLDDVAAPTVYVPRVKMLLTGLAATDAEVQAVTANPAALRDLIDGWMRLPQFKGRMLDFFRNAFQQNNVDVDAISSGLELPDLDLRWDDRARLARTVMDSFPLTAWELVRKGRPFHQTVTTQSYMMTTAMMAILSYADTYAVDDDGDTVERLTRATSQQLVLDVLATRNDGLGFPLTVADSIAQFQPGGSGTWTWRVSVPNMTDACANEIVRGRTAGNAAYLPVRPRWNPTGALLGVLFGGEGFADLPDGSACEVDWQTGANRTAPLLDEGDWSDWRMVTVETLPVDDANALPRPYFWDLPALRSADTLRLRAPRMGFFGTLAWNANWPTNASNQARVTANQALIVSLGQSIIPAAAIAPAPVTASDAAHSTDPACAACHKVLDPLRQFFRQSYTYSYHEQRSLAQVQAPAAFLLGGMDERGQGVGDLARILAAHPHFALGWAQKLQFWANSNAADESDPELQRIARTFQRSNYDFRILVREVFSSPLVTLAKGTLTYAAQGGVTIGIARRDQLCAALSARLELPDACGQTTPDASWWQYNVRQTSQLIATDAYYRAAELPSLPRNPDLFFRDSVEAMCGWIADRVVDQDGSRYSSRDAASVGAAVTDMVANVMGIPASDPRHQDSREILAGHYQAALDATQSWNTTGALRSTFVLACTAPSTVLVGL